MRRRHFIKGLCACCGTLGLSELLGAIHEVKKGDTLYSISRECEVSVAELMKANPGLRPDKLKIGQALQLPEREQKRDNPVPSEKKSRVTDPPRPSSDRNNATDPEFHTVSRGETLTQIAHLTNTTVTELKSLNHLSSSDIYVGQKLRISNSASPTKDTPVEPEPTPTAAATQIKTPSVQPTPASTARYLFVSPVKKEIDTIPKTTRQWKYVVVHHSGTSTGDASIFEYYHREVRGMENGMAYHFVIGNGSDTKDGEIEVGNRWKKQLQGGHLRSDEQNEIAIGICLVGDFNRSRPTKKQIAALIELITYLRQKQSPRELRFFVHRDINIRPTDCPGRLFPAQAMYQLFGKEK
jgi:LysM repeat protein